MINETVQNIQNRTNESLNLKRVRILLEILVAFLPILVLGGLGTWLGTDTFLGGMIVTLGYALSILVATFVLKSRGSSWQDIGLARPGSWPRTVLLSIGALAALFIMTIALQIVALNLPWIEVPPVDQSRFNPLDGNLVVFLLLVVLAWTTIAFGEEMFYRAFLITQLGDVFQKSKLGTALALIASSIIFGFAHVVDRGSKHLLHGSNIWGDLSANRPQPVGDDHRSWSGKHNPLLHVIHRGCLSYSTPTSISSQMKPASFYEFISDEAADFPQALASNYNKSMSNPTPQTNRFC
jgi:membrane protease YdiL (CAAX protease family)